MQNNNTNTNIDQIIEELAKLIPAEQLLIDEPLKEYTSFRIGGPAKAVVLVSNEKELSDVLSLLAGTETEHFLIGNGSNLLVSDKGYNGIVIKLAGNFEGISRDGDTVTVGSAMLLSRTSAFAQKEALSGFEFASGIPGTIGGAIFMNAGAYGGEMKDIVTAVRLMSPDGAKTAEVPAEEMDFGYRHSALEENGWIATEVKLKLEPGDPEEIKARVMELAKKRNDKQPVTFPSAGSTFKRPATGYAAAMIEEAGLKGVSVGDAEVSTKHSGFVINKGNATCADVMELMRIVIDRVHENTGVTLEPEVRFLGEEF